MAAARGVTVTSEHLVTINIVLVSRVASVHGKVLVVRSLAAINPWVQAILQYNATKKQ